MSARVGIELSPSACRIVELEPAPGRGRDARTTRVRSFRILPPSGDETRAAFAALRKRTAAVVVWNAPSEHRQVVVSGGTYESMRADALASLAAADIPTQGVAADIAPVAGNPRRGVRQPVVVAIASSAEMTAALQPLRDAGIRLRSVTTPAVALTSIARQRREFSVPGAIEAYVAIEPAVTCLALVRDAVLVAAHHFPWGHVDAGTGRERPRQEMASRLAAGVIDCVAALGGGRDIGQVCVCGAVPELRSMTLPLMEALDVEVEPLDSLFCIDAAALPDPAEGFRERSGELRLAWAAAADWPAPINLLRGRRRRASKALLMRAAVGAGVAAGLAVGWRVQRSDLFRSTAPKQAVQARAVPPATLPRASTAQPLVQRGATPRSNGTSPRDDRDFAPPPVPNGTSGVRPPNVSAPAAAPAAVNSSARRVVAPVPPDSGPQIPADVLQSRRTFGPPSDVGPQIPAALLAARRAPASGPSAAARPANAAPPPAEPTPVRTASAASVRREPSPPPVRTEPGASPLRTPPQRPPVRSEPAAQPIRTEPPMAASSDRPAPPRAEPSVRRSAPAAARVRPATVDVPLPFEGVLGTILYSPDRKLALVDGRIVGIGDRVRDARVVDISTSAVLLRDAQGRLRQLSMSSGVR
jgi:hypothetical protein